MLPRGAVGRDDLLVRAASVTPIRSAASIPFRDGLGLLPDSACPTTTISGAAGPRFHAVIADEDFPAGYAADDGVALCFEGTTLREVVASRPHAAAYRVELDGGEVVEHRLAVRRLAATAS